MNRCFSKLAVHNNPRILQAVVVVTAALFLVGCGTPPPEIVPVTGRVTIDGKPINNVEVRFYPTIEGLDGNMVGIGVTDADGNYKLALPGKPDSGACACETKIVIMEGPLPEGIRGGPNEREETAKFEKSLKNRPIPKDMTRIADTPLSVTVTTDQTVYDLELAR
ncbi:MAG: hypothetical protein AB8B55_16270 [Mariniblastus sp.]